MNTITDQNHDTARTDDTRCESCASCQCRDLKQTAANFIIGIYVIPLVIAAVIFAALMILLFGIKLFTPDAGVRNGGNSRTN